VTPPADPRLFILKTPPYEGPPLIMNKASEPPEEEPDPEGVEDPTEPRSPSAAAVNSAEQAALYAESADRFTSQLGKMVVDVFQKALPDEHDKALEIYNCYDKAVEATRSAQADAREAGNEAVEALTSPETAQLHAEFAADAAAKALENLDTAGAAYREAMGIRGTLAEFRLGGG
jgi:hypothetical protein